MAILAVFLGSAGCNALTNYLDREIDGRMQRTRRRALPSGRIDPPAKCLPLGIALVVAGLILAWVLNPVAFGYGLTGTATAVVARKRSITHVPLGELSSCAPVLVGWLAVNSQFRWGLFFLCALFFFWTPIHVWSLMTAYREDYLGAGLRIFPLLVPTRIVTVLLLVLSCFMVASSLGLFWAERFGWLYLGAALFLGSLILSANVNLLRTGASHDAWRVYKLTAYPYLGLILSFICLDLWM